MIRGLRYPVENLLEQCLRGCGLVTGRAEGRQAFYLLAQPVLLDLLAAAEGVLEATGEAVRLPCG